MYIPFIEKALTLLSSGGALGFICSDRWTKNRYGAPLRQFISDGFRLKAYIDMVGTDAFHSEVSAYPAITVLEKGRGDITYVAHNPRVDRGSLAIISREVRTGSKSNGSTVRELVGVVNHSEPWILESTDQMAVIRRVEKLFPSLEQVGCKVGIGVATGADKAFIGDFESLDVEDDRKLRLVATRDIVSGEVKWKGLGVINPFGEDGTLVNLDDYPRLANYLNERRDLISSRHCARKMPRNWYRTIDRIVPELGATPKLLIPDIKGEANVVFEDGQLYPHHNLYYITSGQWDLRSLQAVLLSSVTRLFISTYSTRMRGGYIRFQAQYLRRLRLPEWRTLPESLREELAQAAISRDFEACNQVTFELYGLSCEERAAVGGSGASG